MRVFQFVIKKKGKGPWNRFPFFLLNDSDIFLKYLNSNHNLPSYSLFSKCFSWFFYLGVHRSTGAFLRLFFLFFYFLLLLSRVTRSRARFLHIKTNGKNKLFFNNHSNIQIRRFFSVLIENKSCGKYCSIIIRIGTNSALLAFSLGM